MKQNLLLLEDVDGVGRSGEIVSVSPGFSRNYLLPEKKAILASKQTIRLQERLKEERAKRAVVDKKEAEELAKKMEGLVLTIEVKVDADGRMYGSVTNHDIVLALSNEGLTIDKKFIQLKKPIKETGIMDVALKLKEGVPASFKLKILPEGGLATILPATEELKTENKEPAT